MPKITTKIDLVLVDLPYGQTACEWDTIIDLKKMWEELKKVCKRSCIYIFFCTTSFGYKLYKVMSNGLGMTLYGRNQKQSDFLMLIINQCDNTK